MKVLKITLTALVLGLGLHFYALHGQTPTGIGQWRVHYPYFGATHLTMANNKVYAANKSSLYYWDKEDFALRYLSKKDGLSGIDINKLGNYKSELLVVGYRDGNIDFVNDREISQFDDIQRSTIIGSKGINNFYTLGSKLYVATDYGLSIIDMGRREVSDSYLNISSDGSQNAFYAVVFSQDADSIFVASQKGVMAAKFSPGVNLSDFSNWKMYGPADGLPAGDKRAIGRIGNVVLAGSNGSGVFYFNGSQWVQTMSGSTVRNISSGETSAITCIDNKVYRTTAIGVHEEYSVDYIYNPQQAFLDGDDIWLVEAGVGISSYKIGAAGPSNYGYPEGPFTQDTYRMKYIDGKIVNFRGGLDGSFGNVYKESCIMFLGTDDHWKSYTIGNIPNYIPAQTRDLLDGARHPSGKWYFPTYGWGLLEWDGQTFTIRDTNNSALKRVYLTSAITGRDGTVWIGAHAQGNNPGADFPFLHGIAPNGTWSSFKALQTTGKYPQEIVEDNQSNKWIRLGASGGVRGVMWFKEINRTTGTSQQVYFNTDDAHGALPSLSVNTLDVDKTGQVWLGTDKGVAIFTNPSQISPTSIPKAYLPIVGGFPLFFDKRINCIKVDGANRKWVGTPDGVFLLTADGLETIHHFTKENSPLLDNNIVTITINEVTGEVFFGTDRGILSYRGDATTGGETHENVLVFPNPVERGYDGYVGVSGLANNARVKITDVAGRLTYETPANGGTASWNLKDYNGRRVIAGVYLIFSASDDGSERFVGKIAVLD